MFIESQRGCLVNGTPQDEGRGNLRDKESCGEACKQDTTDPSHNNLAIWFKYKDHGSCKEECHCKCIKYDINLECNKTNSPDNDYNLYQYNPGNLVFSLNCLLLLIFSAVIRSK